MYFWIFMSAMALLIPAAMIIFGRKYEKAAPKRINAFSGYRTAMSMKNRDTWEFAHNHIGKLWKKWGWWMLPASAVAMLLCFGKTEDEVGLMGGLVCSAQAVAMCIPMIMTERALKATFDKYGMRKEEN